MNVCKVARLVAVGFSLLGGIGLARSGGFPDHQIRIIVPIQPKGIIDAIAKPLADQLTKVMGQSVVTDYRPGGITNIGSAFVAHAPGDGYTLLAHSRQLVNNVFIFNNLPFDVEKDFMPISLVARTAFLIVVSPALPVKSISDLIALAKARPGKLTYANSGKASNQQMAVELFKMLSHTDIAMNEYDGGGPATDSVIRGQSDMGIFAQAAVMQLVRDGKLRALATTGSHRSAALPDLPSVAETGLVGYEFSSWVGIFAPASTPQAVIATIHSSLVQAARSPEFSKLMATQGAEIVVDTPEDFHAFVRAELARWGKIISESGIERE
jgi:tripartite-type tricarboxylate transporter receptor subunit TctC